MLAWRDVPVEAGLPGAAAREVMPSFRQVVVAGDRGQSGLELDRMAFVLRKRAEHEIPGLYFPSLSSRTLVYKGMLTAPQLPEFFHDLSRPAVRVGARPGARPVLDQYLPQLAAGPPLPVRGPQRRVQHRAGQPQLDADARGHARQRAHPWRHFPDLPRGDPGRERLHELRRGARAAPPRVAGRCRTPC